jgi:hypothetical protein
MQAIAPRIEETQEYKDRQSNAKSEQRPDILIDVPSTLTTMPRRNPGFELFSKQHEPNCWWG